MLAGLRDRGADIVPLLVATAVPGGILSRECYLSLKTELLRRLRESLPVDGVLLPLHGGAAVEEIGDLEGDLVEAVRHVVGPEVPIVGTLDLHAHVSEKMVAGTEALLAWETYPHRDTYSTGVRGVRMLLDILDGKVRPAMAMAKVPVIVGGIMGSTEGSAPFADVMRFAKAMEQRPGVLSTSTFLVQPYLDHPGMGGGGLVITDGDITLAVELSTQIAEMYWERRFDLEPRRSGVRGRRSSVAWRWREVPSCCWRPRIPSGEAPPGTAWLPCGLCWKVMRRVPRWFPSSIRKLRPDAIRRERVRKST